MKLWGGRFESGPSEVFERFSGSLDFDRRLIDADITGSQAWARALEAIGILNAEERARLVDSLEEIRSESRGPAFFDGAADEDVHTLVIRKLKEKTGGLADKIHTGRSRNEQVSLDVRLWLREEIDAVNERVFHDVNDAVYRAGFARRQETYERNYADLFACLDWLTERLAARRYLVGETITEADIRLFPTLVRFDAVYHNHFRCNRHKLTELPVLWAYARDLFQTPGFGRHR